MADTTIAWTDKTWNPVRGCARVSPGCMNCYAEVMAGRFSDPGMWGHGFAERTAQGFRWTRKVAPVPEKLAEPLHWRKACKVFVNSTSDLFHEDVPFTFIDDVFEVMALCPQHTFQILTKRPERMREWADTLASRRPARDRNGHWDGWSNVPFCAGLRCEGHDPDTGWCGTPWPLPNVWLGVSVESQKYANERIPHLLAVPAAVRFLSCEPLLEAVDLTSLHGESCEACGETVLYDALSRDARCACCVEGREPVAWERLHWVIVGGESGPKARPFDLAWARSLRDQCKAAGVAYFCKQLGARPVNACGCETKEMQGGELRCADCFDGTQPVLGIHDCAGADPAEWPSDLQIRLFPGDRWP